MTAHSRGETEMNFFKLPIYALAAALMTAPTIANAWWWDDDDDDEVEIPLEEAELFFELNDSDGDLGIHGFADGDEWKELEIEAPNGRELMEINVKSKLKRQGVTELFFESAEPCFPDDCEDGDVGLDPEKFFKRFPEGVYEIETELLNGDEQESEVYLSHVIPAAPEIETIGGTPFDEDNCTVAVPDGNGDVTVEWAAVTMSHEELGTLPPVNILQDVIYYEFVIEVDEEPWNSKSIIQPLKDVMDDNLDVTNSKTIPADFFVLAPADEYKIEILVRVDNGDDNPGNKSAVETCFVF